MIGFQELAYALKTRFPQKEVSVHLVYVSDDYYFLLEPWKAKAKGIGLDVVEEPPLPPRMSCIYWSPPQGPIH